MQTLGYIVYKGKIKNILPCIKVVSSFRLIEDKLKPTLIIGLEEAKKHTSSFSILNKKLSDNLFWTFGKREKKEHFDKDIEHFQIFVLKNACYDIKYYYFNILSCKLFKIKSLLHIIKCENGNIFYIGDKMLYMYRENYVLGISIDILSYIGIDLNRVLMLIQTNHNNVIYDTIIDKSSREGT